MPAFQTIQLQAFDILHGHLCRLVQDNPIVLDIAAFQKTMQHAKQIMGPDTDIIDTLKRRPEMIFQFQQGKDIIPYDEVPTNKGQN